MKLKFRENTSSIEENESFTKAWEKLEFNIGEDCEYVPKSKIFWIFSNLLYYVIAMPILAIINKVVYDLKIESRENLENVKGAISVSNHVLYIDCTMIGLAWGYKKLYYTTAMGSFKMPFIRKLIKLLRAIPIPDKIKNREKFIKAIKGILKEEEVVHVYPEGELIPYCTKIRSFKNGAFDFAVNNQVPVVPMVFTFREPEGLRKLFKKKKDVTLTILEPIRAVEEEIPVKEKIERLKQAVYEEMVDYNDYMYAKEINNDRCGEAI